MPPPTFQQSTTGMSLSSDSSSKIDLADQKEIEAIWKEIYVKVLDLAGGDPEKVQKTLGIDDVLRYIDGVQKAEARKSEKYGTFKDVVRKTLQCISHVGGIIADGVSDIFAPAGLCFNALNFVIEAWQGYEGTFENLAELLSKCAEFLERLQSYQGRMDARLTRLASQNLRLFVEICDKTIKLRKKHARFLRFTSQLFLNDDGVQDLLAMMDKLNSKEALLVSAQTYRLVSDSAGDVKLILEAQRELKREDEAKKWRRSIAKALGFPGTALDSDGEPVPAWQRAFDTRLNSLVEGTGAWWKSDETFSHWATARYPEESILILSGASGTGKTSMMANTIRSIRRLDSEAPSSRMVAVYYFADGDKRKPDDEDESGCLERVSRTLLWQLATSYEAMTKAVATALEQTDHFEGALDQWERLFFSNKELQNSNTTFYIFIDTLDPELVAPLQRLCKLPDRGKVRVFVTARPEMVTGYLNPTEDLSFVEVPISRRNSHDVERYIISRMDNIQMLRDTGRQGISEWRKIILNQLRDKCAGDYFKLNTSLASLSKVDLVEDIKEVLKEAGRPRVDQIKAGLRRLNNTRTVKEIQEINEIILWIDHGRRYFSVEVMDAILSVKQRRPSITARGEEQPPLLHRRSANSPKMSTDVEEPAMLSTISLLPLAQKLRDKYTLFSVTDSGVVDWRSPEIRNQIPTKEDQQIMVTGDGEKSSLQQPQAIQETEINIIRHFLNNVCPPELYTRFEFEQFFNQKLGACSRDYIHLDPNNAEIRIVFTCLVILTDGELRGQMTLRQYAMYWLLEHMLAVNLFVVDRKLKNQVGPLLVKLFTDDHCIDSLFWCFDANVSTKTWEQGEATYLREARVEWLYSTAGVQELRRWLGDSSITKDITDEIGRNFVAAIKAPGANLHQVILSHAAKRMATHLFIEVEFLKRHFLAASCFLRGYLARLEGRDMPDDPAVYRDDKWEQYEKWEGESFTLAELGEIEELASKELVHFTSTPTQASLWEIHGALQAFQLCDDDEQRDKVSQLRARRALELNPQNWHACHFVAGRPSTTKEEGVELLKRARNAVDTIRAKDATWMDSSANTSLLARITFDLGNKLWELDDFAAAARIRRESLGYDYVHFSTYAKVLGGYQERQQWGEIIEFIATLNETSEQWGPYFDELVNDFIVTLVDEDSDMLASAADATKRWGVIERFFELSTEIGHKQHAYDLLFLLREGYARTLELTEGTVDEKTVVSIRVAALESNQAHPSDTLPPARVYAVTDLLAQTYLHNALQVAGSEKVVSLGLSLSSLLPDASDLMDAWGNITTICCIIRYHYKFGSKSGPAKRWIERIVRAALELLSDSDQDNDTYAYWLLGRLFVTVEDDENHKITWNIRNAIQASALERWDEWISTPIASPVQRKIVRHDSIASRLDEGISLEYSTIPAMMAATITTTAFSVRGDRGRPSSAHSGEGGKAVKRSSPLRNGDAPKENGHSHSHSNGSNNHNNTTNNNDKPIIRTATSSSAPNPKTHKIDDSDSDTSSSTISSGGHSDTTHQPKGGPPTRIATDIIKASPSETPPKPTWFVDCSGGCGGRQWTVTDEVLLSCADCVGNVRLCRPCHSRLIDGEQLLRRGFRCRREHTFLEIPAWGDGARYDGAPRGALPLPVPVPAKEVGGGGEKKGPLLDRRWMPLEEWKESLRKLYLPE